ncbi:Siroheme synthase [Aquimixticola soesokkakensis]|uniref:Siroheme synthase n=1 Tax=Aquimixticola soesokkakensis TaxID=1519096 RepID=A0A1Y5SNX3_9RHOB|nr:siroheme synthase CysG [Aquimixticola soesokkakensis]SLN44859.1 Siroheme synthase [Aquimixticola soesokkakensis]
MKFFPMFLRMADRDVLIAGGGEQAAQKTRLMLKTEARITVHAAQIDDELAALVAEGKLSHATGPLTPDSFKGKALVFIGTGSPAADACLADLAALAGALVNVVDRPDLCEATTPSLVDRDPLVVAIGTEGAAPVLARAVKTRLEELLEPRLGEMVGFAGRMRDAVARSIPKENRREFWRWTFNDAPRRLFARGAEREAFDLIKQAIHEGRVPTETGRGSIALVGAGPGARDLLTLRAVARLQEADVIFYDRLVDPDVLELARRDAERVFVGKVVGAHEWPQDRINEIIVETALAGQKVVRLKSGDPAIFARTGEELDAAAAAGVPCEIVSGITAASAAAAAMNRPLTERGVTDRVTFATGTLKPGTGEPDWASLAKPGTVLALYMAVHTSDKVRENLLAQGVAGDVPVDVVAHATTRREIQISTTVAALPEALAAANITSQAILLIRVPKNA